MIGIALYVGFEAIEILFKKRYLDNYASTPIQNIRRPVFS